MALALILGATSDLFINYATWVIQQCWSFFSKSANEKVNTSANQSNY